ncbi:Atrial natriuretic peptide receptor 2 [Hypsibius exemplaris]|uniref:guanylate cyclase n=1 Tax=Hypsibius exemplaris TaxID=2072580 RepID=A0A9X6RM60_HYPEX|nr:Atrial natriuretic peptide receptor 2 [Hypsibius exemplaris]
MSTTTTTTTPTTSTTTTSTTTSGDALVRNLLRLSETSLPSTLKPSTTLPALNSTTPADSTVSTSGDGLDLHAPSLTTVKLQMANKSVSPSASTKVVLNACLLTERTSWYNYDRSAAAVDMALEFSNEQILAPVGMHLVLTYSDIGTSCAAKNSAVAFAMDLIYRGIHCDAFIGAGCAYDFQTLYDVADFLAIPFIGIPAAGVGADADFTLYKNMVRLSVVHLNTVKVILNFLKRYKYWSPTVIQDLDISLNQQMSVILKVATMNTNRTLAEQTNFNEISSKKLTYDQITTSLKDGMAGSRAFVLITNASITRQIMLVARDLGLIGGDYVFIAIELFPSSSWGTFTWQMNDQFDEAAREAYKVLLLVSLTPSVNVAFDVFEKEVKEAAAVRSTNRYQYAPGDGVDLVTAHFYDAIVFYASIMRDMFINGTDIFPIENFITWYSNYTFDSPIQGAVRLDVNGDRISSYVIRTYNERSGVFEPAFSASPVSPVIIKLGPFVWPGGNTLPPNEPRCGYNGKNPICAPKPLSGGSVAAAAIIPTLLLLAGIIVGYIFISRFINKNQDPFWWRVFIHELSSISVASQSSQASRMAASGAGSRFQTKSQKSVNTDEELAKKAEMDEDAEEAVERTQLAFVLYGKTATLKDNTVALRELPQPYQRMTNSMSGDMSALKGVKHNNLQDFLGVAINDENLCEYAIGEVCQKGSLMALLEKTTMTLDWQFKHSIMKGIAAGMAYLHSTKVISHGDLTAHTVLIDSRFVIKITDYGLHHFRPLDDIVPPDDEDQDRDFARLLWRAPELLRKPVLGGSQKGDVYSFAILLQQIILRSAPYESSIESQRSDYLAHAKDLVMEVKRGANPPQRPMVPVSSCPGALHSLLDMCWDEHAVVRITFIKIREILQKALGKSGENIIEHLITRMDLYATELEHEAEEKMKMFLAEKERSEELLKGMLPKVISDKLRRGEIIYPEVFDSTTVQFSDIHGFAEVMEAAPTPFVTIEIMNTLYGLCDNIIEKFDVYKIETVNDNYLLVSGLPVRNGIQHAGEMATLALTLRKEVGTLVIPSSPDTKLKLRVGINSGSCVASVVGLKMPKYCLFGDTVNTASRMESHGEAGKIHLSPTTAALLEKIGNYFLSPRGPITVKGKGSMETFWLIAKTTMD